MLAQLVNFTCNYTHRILEAKKKKNGLIINKLPDNSIVHCFALQCNKKPTDNSTVHCFALIRSQQITVQCIALHCSVIIWSLRSLDPEGILAIQPLICKTLCLTQSHTWFAVVHSSSPAERGWVSAPRRLRQITALQEITPASVHWSEPLSSVPKQIISFFVLQDKLAEVVVVGDFFLPWHHHLLKPCFYGDYFNWKIIIKITCSASVCVLSPQLGGARLSSSWRNPLCQQFILCVIRSVFVCAHKQLPYPTQW